MHLVTWVLKLESGENEGGYYHQVAAACALQPDAGDFRGCGQRSVVQLFTPEVCSHEQIPKSTKLREAWLPGILGLSLEARVLVCL